MSEVITKYCKEGFKIGDVVWQSGPYNTAVGPLVIVQIRTEVIEKKEKETQQFIWIIAEPKNQAFSLRYDGECDSRSYYFTEEEAEETRDE